MPEEELESNSGASLERIRQTLLRRRWWVAIPACIISLATVAVLAKVPNRYTSNATLVVVQQQVPQRYVVLNDTTEMAVALQAMQQEVLSRPQLERIIRDFGLYAKESKRLAPEQVMALMLRDIYIEPITSVTPQKDLNAFRISFTTENPYVAQQVTSTLTSLFIQESLKSQEEQAVNTTGFLHQRMEDAQKKLEVQNLGELPEQQQGNIGVMQGLQAQLQNTASSLSRAQEQRVYLESLLSGYQSMASNDIPLPGVTSSTTHKLSPLDTAQAELNRLRTERASLLVRFTSQHPDVLKNARDLAAAEETVEHLKTAVPAPEDPGSSGAPQVARTSGGAVDNPSVAQVKSQIESNRLEIENLQKDEKTLRASVAQYQNRLNLTPVREQQLTSINRDYELVKKDYSDLVNKELESQLATSLEKNQGGRKFRLVDPPSFPVLASSPNRLKLNLGGLAGGIAFGLALALLIEMKDRSFHTEAELSAELAPPIIVSVPLILTPEEERRQSWSYKLQWIAASALMLLVSAVEFYAYRHR
jgi:polysaccharide chain length determinant protein (PEP-CTERM system associated)